MMNNPTIQRYTNFYQDIPRELFPSEWVVRIFMGNYPKLCLSDQLAGRSILEVSCGDGRNFSPLLAKSMEITATEVSPQIVDQLQRAYPDIHFEVAMNGALPFQKHQFDYLLSWNQIYYMGQDPEAVHFESHVSELARVLKPEGKLIISLPMPDSFIFKNCETIDAKYCRVNDDPFGGIRNGEIMRKFQSVEDIEVSFSPYFKNFIFASSRNDHFGIQNNWHVFVCECA